MKKLLIFFCILLSMVAQGGLTIAGRQVEAIIIPHNAKYAEKLAANELRRFIRQATGVDLPVFIKANGPAIHVGATEALAANGIDASRFEPDEYIVKGTRNAVLVAGRDYPGGPLTGLNAPFDMDSVYNDSLKLCAFGSSGTLFAAYTFLEQALGIRFYWPGELGTVVPKHTANVEIGKIKLHRKPAFKYRNIFFGVFSRADEDDVLWYKQLGLGGEAPIQLTHSFRLLESIAKENPVFYALLNGKRHRGMGFSASEPQYCLSNPDFRQKVVKYICSYFDAHPEQRLFLLAPDEGFPRICECEQCQAQLRPKLGANGIFSYHVWDFINEVAKGVHARHPDCSVGGLAYSRYSILPPEIKLHPSVSVIICRQRAFTVCPEYRKALRAHIHAWAKKTRNIYFWDSYQAIWEDPWQNYPVFFPDAMQDDLRFMAKKECCGEYIAAYTQHTKGQRKQIALPGMQHLDIYITSKLYWQPDLDMDKLLNEYYQLFYGPAADDMREFWETARRCWNENGLKNVTSNNGAIPQSRPTDIFTAEDMSRLEDCLKSAGKKAGKDTNYARRIAIIQSECQFAMEHHVQKIQIEQQSIAIPRVGNKHLRWQFTQNDGCTSNYPTYVDILYDKSNLYLRLFAFEPEMDKIKANATKDDPYNASADDCFKIFLHGSVEERMTAPYFRIDINANGAMETWKVAPGGTGLDKILRSPCRVSTRRLAHRWEANIAIPMTELGIPEGEIGNSFLMNIYRFRVAKGPGEISSMVPSFTTQYGKPDKLCQIIFQ